MAPFRWCTYYVYYRLLWPPPVADPVMLCLQHANKSRQIKYERGKQKAKSFPDDHAVKGAKKSKWTKLHSNRRICHVHLFPNFDRPEMLSYHFLFPPLFFPNTLLPLFFSLLSIPRIFLTLPLAPPPYSSVPKNPIAPPLRPTPSFPSSSSSSSLTSSEKQVNQLFAF